MTIAEHLARAKTDLDNAYEAGYNKGLNDAPPSGNYQDGFDAGKQAEYDRFWDMYQDGGNRTDYQMAFAGKGWNASTIKPRYDIRPTACFEMFRGCGEFDATEIGVSIDFSQSTTFTNFAHSSGITHIGVFNASNASGFSYSFYNCEKLQTIDKLVLKTDGTQTFTNAFDRCTALANITIEGTIGKSISFVDCPLSYESMKNIIEHLKDYYNDSANAYTQTITFSQECWDLLAEHDEESPLYQSNGGGWEDFITREMKWSTS